MRNTPFEIALTILKGFKEGLIFIALLLYILDKAGLL